MVKDFVCGMEVDEKKAPFKSEYEGEKYYFCSSMCKTNFENNPKNYIK